MLDDAERKQARGRLIDHFKRVYTIVIGLAITEAVKRLFPLQLDGLPLPSIFMFLTFFVTVVPIFHGGDRSLDVKYFNSNAADWRKRAAYLWDVYMLILTAILFVCIAESVPGRSTSSTGVEYVRVDLFYNFFAVMLVFDVIVLLVDLWKSDTPGNLGPYVAWMGANILFAALLVFISFYTNLSVGLKADDVVDLHLFSVNLTNLTLVVLVAAVIRTVIDYIAGGNFLFPE